LFELIGFLLGLGHVCIEGRSQYQEGRNQYWRETEVESDYNGRVQRGQFTTGSYNSTTEAKAG